MLRKRDSIRNLDSHSTKEDGDGDIKGSKPRRMSEMGQIKSADEQAQC
jgi:hypothetical protein